MIAIVVHTSTPRHAETRPIRSSPPGRPVLVRSERSSSGPSCWPSGGTTPVVRARVRWDSAPCIYGFFFFYCIIAVYIRGHVRQTYPRSHTHTIRITVEYFNPRAVLVTSCFFFYFTPDNNFTDLPRDRVIKKTKKIILYVISSAGNRRMMAFRALSARGSKTQTIRARIIIIRVL